MHRYSYRATTKCYSQLCTPLWQLVTCGCVLHPVSRSLHIFWGLSLALSRTTRVWGGSAGGGSSSNEKCFGGMGGGSSSSPRSVTALWVTMIGRKPVHTRDIWEKHLQWRK